MLYAVPIMALFSFATPCAVCDGVMVTPPRRPSICLRVRPLRGAEPVPHTRAFFGGCVGDDVSPGSCLTSAAMMATYPGVVPSSATARAKVEEPSASRCWVRWLPGERTFHSALCHEVKDKLHAQGWKYATKPPKSKKMCLHCAAVIDAAPKTLDGDPLVEFIKRRGFARDYLTAPSPDVALGSYPERLRPELLVDVSENIIAGFAMMVQKFVVVLKAGDRQPGYFIRSGAGWGKTFNLQELLTWIIVASVAFEHDCSATTGEAGRKLKRQQDKVVSALQKSGTLGMARAVTAFCVNFNGQTPFSAAEVGLAATAGPSVLLQLRVCYSELVDTKLKWEAFLEVLILAISAGELTIGDVRRAADVIMRFCRGHPGSIPFLVVDELAKVKRSSMLEGFSVVDEEDVENSGEDEELQHSGLDENVRHDGVDDRLQPVCDDELQQQVSDGASLLGSVGAGAGNKEDWAAEVCSSACVMLQNIGGTFMYSTLKYDVMKRESTRSGRGMFPAIELKFLEPTAFARALVVELAPLYADGVVALLGLDLLAPGEPVKDQRASAWVLLLCGLLGGHPRFARQFLLELKKRVKALVCELGESQPETIFSSTVQLACWQAFDEALGPSSMSITRSSLGGMAGIHAISSAALLGQPVELDAPIIRRVSGEGVHDVVWDELSGEGIVLLKHHGHPAEGISSSLDWAVPSLHPFAALRMALMGGTGVRDVAFRNLLLCPGTRLTGERLEGVIANWCVLSSYCRAQYPLYYSSVTLKNVWKCRPHPNRTFGNKMLDDVYVDASATRKSGVRMEQLIDVLKFVAVHPERAVDAVFRLNVGAARRSQFAVDIVEFFRISRAFGQYKVGDLIAAVYQGKDCGEDVDGRPKLQDVNKSWDLLESSVLAEDGMWDKWKDNIVFIYANRHPNKFGTRLTSPSRTQFDSGRACSQTVLLSGDDLSGWLPHPIPTFLRSAQYLEQANAAEDLTRFQTPS